MSQASPTDAKRCATQRRDGAPCKGAALSADSLCFAHSPALQERRTEARRRGGANSATRAPLRGLMPPRLINVYDVLEQALSNVLDGSLDPRQATAAAALGRALVAVLQAGEVEERVRKLEVQTNLLGGRRA